jgi:hypothetical protein
MYGGRQAWMANGGVIKEVEEELEEGVAAMRR